MAKAAGADCEGSVAGGSDCGMSEKVQTDLLHSPRSTLDPRQTGKGVNLKAVLRLMRKLNLLSVVRRHQLYAH